MQGTNLGEKQHSAPMQPTMNMDTAAKTLNLQTDVKVSEVEAMIYDDFTKTDKRWSNKPTAPYLVSFGEGLEFLYAFGIQRIYSRTYSTAIS